MDFSLPLSGPNIFKSEWSQKIPIVSAGNPTLYSANQHPFYLTFWSPKEKGCFFFLFFFQMIFFSWALTLMLQCSLIAKNTRTDFRSSWNFIRNRSIKKRRDGERGMAGSDTVETALWNFPNDVWSVGPLKPLRCVRYQTDVFRGGGRRGVLMGFFFFFFGDAQKK